MKKKILFIVIGCMLAASLLLNLYHYGYRYVYQRGFNQGVAAVSNAVAQQLQETGKVQMQTKDSVVVLVPERSVAASRPRIENDPIIP